MFLHLASISNMSNSAFQQHKVEGRIGQQGSNAWQSSDNGFAVQPPSGLVSSSIALQTKNGFHDGDDDGVLQSSEAPDAGYQPPHSTSSRKISQDVQSQGLPQLEE